MKNDQPDRYFLRRASGDVELDGPIGGPVSGVVDDPNALNQAATSLANAAPQMKHIFGDFKQQSYEGGSLDFKHQLHGNILWNAGNGLYVHNDKVGNTAWAYYANKRMGIPLFMALGGAQYQALKQTYSRDDPLDQSFIRRGYSIP